MVQWVVKDEDKFWPSEEMKNKAIEKLLELDKEVYSSLERAKKEAEALIQDAKALEQAGVFAIVLECVPAELGKEITQAVGIPTIGIGAGPACSGQIQVIHDILANNLLRVFDSEGFEVGQVPPQIGGIGGQGAFGQPVLEDDRLQKTVKKRSKSPFISHGKTRLLSLVPFVPS